MLFFLVIYISCQVFGDESHNCQRTLKVCYGRSGQSRNYKITVNSSKKSTAVRRPSRRVGNKGIIREGHQNVERKRQKGIEEIQVYTSRK